MATSNKISRIVRVGVAGAVGAFAIQAYAGSRPEPSLSLESIRNMRSLDAATAESAPQQTVVNGGETNDLLAYMAEQHDVYAAQQGALLLIIAVIGVLLLLSPLLQHVGTDRSQAPRARAVNAESIGTRQGSHARQASPVPVANPNPAAPQ